MTRNLFIITALLLLTSATALAAENITVVTAGRIEEDAKTVTQSVTVIGREEIQKNQQQDLGGLLRNHGIQLDAYNPSGSLSQISLRGIRSSAMGSDLQGSVLILVDGRRVGTDNISMMPTVNIERIEVLRGPASVQYGTSAMGGVVNIITMRGGDELSAHAEIGGGSFDTFRTQAGVSGGADGFDFALGGFYTQMNSYKIGDGKKYRNSGLDNKYSYSANLGYSFLDEHRVGLTALGVFANDMGSPNDIRANNHSAYNDRYNYSFDAVYDGGARDYGLAWKTRYYTGRSHYLNDDPKDTFGWAYYKSKTDYQGAQGQLSWEHKIFSLTGGVDWNNYNTLAYSNRDTEDSDYYNTAGFMLAKLNLVDGLVVLSGGLRYDEYKLKVPGQGKRFDNTAPSVGIALNPLDWLTLRAGYGESYRIPAAIEVLGFNDGVYNYIGNRGLKPEKGLGWDAGFEVNKGGLALAVNYFDTDYKDKIVSESSNWVDYQYRNISGKSEFRGIEANFAFDVSRLAGLDFTLRPYANLTRMLKYKSKDGNRLKNVSELDLAYGLLFSHPGLGLDLDLRFVYFGHQRQSDFIAGRDIKTKDTTTVDLFITKTVCSSAELGTLSVKAELKNIFDSEYYSIKEYTQPGRSWWLGLRYDY